jgi:hypothetical protein
VNSAFALPIRAARQHDNPRPPVGHAVVDQWAPLNAAYMDDGQTPCEFSREQLAIMANTTKTRVPPRNIHLPDFGIQQQRPPVDFNVRDPQLEKMKRGLNAAAAHPLAGPDGGTSANIIVYLKREMATPEFVEGVVTYFTKRANARHLHGFDYALERHSRDFEVVRLIFRCDPTKGNYEAP